MWLQVCAENMNSAPSDVSNPDCVGHLMKLGHRAKEWQRRFCILKDACLYFYADTDSGSALGKLLLDLVYKPTVNYNCNSNRQVRCTCTAIEFNALQQLVPATTDASTLSSCCLRRRGCATSTFTPTQRTIAEGMQQTFFFNFQFFTNVSPCRWIAALEYSIDRWIRIG